MARAGLDASDLLTLASGIAVASAGAAQAERRLERLRHGIAAKVPAGDQGPGGQL
jgi:predicted metal-binding protein